MFHYATFTDKKVLITNTYKCFHAMYLHIFLYYIIIIIKDHLAVVLYKGLRS